MPPWKVVKMALQEALEVNGRSGGGVGGWLPSLRRWLRKSQGPPLPQMGVAGLRLRDVRRAQVPGTSHGFMGPSLASSSAP